MQSPLKQLQLKISLYMLQVPYKDIDLDLDEVVHPLFSLLIPQLFLYISSALLGGSLSLFATA